MNDLKKSGDKKLAPVSVIIPCYRCANTIQRAVDSVTAQTMPAQEIILIDDFSNDEKKTLNTLDCLRQKYQKSNIKILRLEKNCGPGSARNAGWDVATQPYLAFLDADDSWHPNKLEIQYQWMAAHPNVVLSGHQSVKIAIDATLPILPEKLSARSVNRSRLIFSNCFPTRSVMLKREITPRFIPGKRYAEDYLLWLTIVFGGQPAYVLNMPMAYSFKEEFGEGGLTGNLWKTQRGVLDTYQRLYKTGLISNPVLILIMGFSTLKYFRRWLIVRCRSALN
ncbi:MAG: glycosyltransferase family 2 protein [Sideroxydans sp.]|nr:glycosyltransferase family 2 protein [Sideroxydans sp.]